MAFSGNEISYIDYRSNRGYNSYIGYNYGSEAYEIDYDFLRRQEEIKRHKQERKRKQAEIEKRERTLDIRHSIMLILAVVVFFAGCVLTITAVSSVAQMRYRITELKEELSVIQNENIVLASEISDTINLDYIEDRAIHELGMTEPQAYQIRTISVPEQSYTVQYRDTVDTSHHVDTELIKEFFSMG